MTKKPTTKKKNPGVPLLDGTGSGTGNAGRGCDTPKPTRKGRNKKR